MYLKICTHIIIFPLISKPTRIGGNCATLIDNIYCNNINGSKMINGIFHTDISDHFSVFSINIHISVFEKANYIKSRAFTTSAIEKFKASLQSTDFINVITSSDSQQAYTLFHNMLSKIYDTCFPLKTIKLNYTTRKL